MNNLIKSFLVILIVSSLTSCINTKIIAHRGFSEIAPENTLASFNKAIDTKADYFELDVHQTKDGALIVIHDESVDRTSSNGIEGKVIEMNLDEIKKVKVGYPKKFNDQYINEGIPTLKEALQTAKGKINVCIELKADNIEKDVSDLLNELNMTDHVIIFAFNDKALAKIKAINPDLKTLLLKSNANLKTIDFAKQNNINAIGAGYSTKITEEFVKYAHKNKIMVFKWTVNDEKQMKELIDLKIDGIITNKPDVALKLR